MAFRFRVRFVLLAMLVIPVVVLGARTAPAEEPVVVIVESEEALATRIRAELTELGFSVHLVGAEERPATFRDLEAVARQAHAVAAIEVRPSAEAVEVWLVDRVTGKALRRELVPAGSGNDDAFVATRVVELLRASLLELALPDHARGEMNATPELRRAARLPPVNAVALSPSRHPSEAGRTLLFDGGFGLASNTGPVVSWPFVDVAAFFRATEGVSFGLSALVSLTGRTVSETEGSARVTMWSMCACSRIEPFSPSNRVQPFVAGGLSVLAFHLDGENAKQGYHATTDQLISAGPELEIGVGLRLSRTLGMRSSVGAIYALPRPVVQFAGREAFDLGRPVAMASLEFEYRAVWEATRD